MEPKRPCESLEVNKQPANSSTTKPKSARLSNLVPYAKPLQYVV